MGSRITVTLGLAFAALIIVVGAKWAMAAKSCGVKSPPATPHRRKAAESVPPLPLPATPLRRTASRCRRH